MVTIGLTGSIAMGKSTAAKMLRSMGVPVYDSDASVHEFYQNEAAAVLRPHFPDAIVDGSIDRRILSGYVLDNHGKMALLESLVHPVIEKNRIQFMAGMKTAGYRIIAIDIPLLFETGGDRQVDVIAVVSASLKTQRERALARHDMTEEKFEAIRLKQVSDREKRQKAHYVISSETSFDHMNSQLAAMLRALR